MYYFVLLYGQPMHDSGTPGVISSSPARIDYTWTVNMMGSAAGTTASDKPG